MIQSDFDGALALSMNLVASLEAAALRGWRGSLPRAVMSPVQTTSQE